MLAGNGNVSSSPADGQNGNSGSVTSSGKPRIGVTVTNLNANNYAVANGLLPNGAYVKEVEVGSPAEKAGIQVADIVVEVDGTVVTSTTQMVSILQQKKAGALTAAEQGNRTENILAAKQKGGQRIAQFDDRESFVLDDDWFNAVCAFLSAR